MSSDPTENTRRSLTASINIEIESQDETKERERLKKKWGNVYNTEEVQEKFQILSYLAPYIICIEKSTKKKGVLMFQHFPRFYFTLHLIFYFNLVPFN